MPGGCERAWVDLDWRQRRGALYQDGCSAYLGTNVYFKPRTRVNGGQCVHVNGDTSDGSCNHKSICLPPPVILEGSTAGYRCSAASMINSRPVYGVSKFPVRITVAAYVGSRSVGY